MRDEKVSRGASSKIFNSYRVKGAQNPMNPLNVTAPINMSDFADFGQIISSKSKNAAEFSFGSQKSAMNSN